MQKKHAPGRIEACLSCKWMLREIGAFSALPHSSAIRPFGLLGRGSLPSCCSCWQRSSPELANRGLFWRFLRGVCEGNRGVDALLLRGTKAASFLLLHGQLRPLASARLIYVKFAEMPQRGSAEKVWLWSQPLSIRFSSSAAAARYHHQRGPKMDCLPQLVKQFGNTN